MADEVDPRLVAALAQRKAAMPPLADLLTALQQESQSSGESMSPFVAGPNGPIPRGAARAENNKPDSAPSWYRSVQPYPINIQAGIEGALMAEGLGSAVQGARSLAGMLKQAGGTVAGRTAGLAGAGIATMPSTANPAEPSALDRMLQQQADLTAQRKAASDERAGQAKTGRGPMHGAASEELTRLDAQLSKLNEMIASEQKRAAEKAYWESPEGKLEAQKREKQAQIDEENRLKGLPTREKMPSWMQDYAIPAAGAVGGAVTYGLTRRSNNQYNSAVQRFLEAQGKGDVPAMTLAQGAIQKLENPGVGSSILKYAPAGLPLELRGYELINDLKKDPNSRAYTEAIAKLENPKAMGVEAGGALLSSLLGYGIGSKLAPLRDPMGSAIAKENPYAKAAPLSSGLSSALQQGEDVRKLLPAPAAASPGQGGSAEAPRGLLARILDTLSGRGSSAPSPSLAGPSSGQSPPLALPAPANPAPPGVGASSQGLLEALQKNPPANRNYPGHHSRYQPRDENGSKFVKGQPEYPDKK